ncbi:MAG TPA: hypothetical protein VFK52_00080, partial [Nocardioidaceae bacterium]|nr:hypothetical protein [Nocardioidaceae bacterium]
MKRSAPLKRRKPLRQVGRKAQREQAAVDAFRLELRLRSHMFCEASTPACLPFRHEGHHAHHCCPADRDRGVHDPERGLWLCFPAHAFVHREPALSYERGWLLRDGGGAA